MHFGVTKFYWYTSNVIKAIQLENITRVSPFLLIFYRNNDCSGTLPSDLVLPKSLSYFSNPGTSPLIGLTIGELFEYACQKYANNEFLVVPFQGIRKTYKQLKEEVT